METNWRYDDGRGKGYDENFDMLIWSQGGRGDGTAVHERPPDFLRFPFVVNSIRSDTASAEVMI